MIGAPNTQGQKYWVGIVQWAPETSVSEEIADIIRYYNIDAILDQEIQNNGGCPEAAGPDRERFLQPRKYQKYPHRSWLGNWLWALIMKIQGYCYLKYREYLQKLYPLDTWCLTKQTNVLRSDTPVIESIIKHARYGQLCCISAVPSLTPQHSKLPSISTNSWGPELFKTLQETSYILLGVQINFSFMIHLIPTWYCESFWTHYPYDNIINIKVHKYVALCLKI